MRVRRMQNKKKSEILQPIVSVFLKIMIIKKRQPTEEDIGESRPRGCHHRFNSSKPFIQFMFLSRMFSS